MATMDGKVAIVTGASRGIGHAVAGRLVADGARVCVTGRKPEALEKAAAELGEPDRVLAVPGKAHDPDHQAEAVQRVLDTFGRLDVLVNNAGVGFGAPGSGRELSADGIELRFAVNYLAGYRLTELLLPLLQRSAPARVVNVASAGQYPLDFSDPMLEGGYDGTVAYRRSKLAQVMYTLDLAARLRPLGVTANALHPATLMDTGMVRHAGFVPVSTVEEGTEATLRLIADPALAGVTGRYFNGTGEARAHPQAYDEAARQQLRKLSEKLLRGALPPEGG